MKSAQILLLVLSSIPSLHAAPILRVNGKVAGDASNTSGLDAAPLASWVWGADESRNQFLRRSFEVTTVPASARLDATCDNVMTVWINGNEVAKSSNWSAPASVDVLKFLKADGKNIISVLAENQGTSAGFILRLNLVSADGTETQVMTGDGDWKISDKESGGWQDLAFDDSAWQKPKEIGKFGCGPWGAIGVTGASNAPIDASALKVAKDFRVELLYSVPIGEQGSWVSLAKDPEGNLFASDQDGKGLFRISVKDSASFTDVSVASVPAKLSSAQGMVWANGSLYAQVTGQGLFRLTDKDGDKLPENVEPLGGATGGGEHGNHAVITAENGKDFFVIAGNHTPMPQDLIKASTVGWEEDLILPRMGDSGGHAVGVMAPGGWICRVTPDGKNYKVISMGYRNQYDIALNRFGDLFSYDADMEWDMGTPWYRPTRICLAASGSEYGWRNGSGKWPAYYEDSLPSLVDIGPGSPTGVAFGTGAKFPTKYQDALFSLDWTFGTIYAVHPVPSGSAYTATVEEFISGAPLPVTDAVVGNDGHLYFTVGGRGTQSGLYRVIYTGSESIAPPTGEGPPEAAQARVARRSLEAFHGKKDAKAVATAWPYLKSTDRFLRNAARVAIEAQPVDEWAKLAFSEKDTQARITAAVALARSNKKELRPLQIASLLELKPGTLEEGQFLGLLRAYQLTFMRLGSPDDAEKAKIIAQLDPQLPSKSDNVNTELVRTLIYLDAPGIVAKTMDLIRKRTKSVAPEWGEIVKRNSSFGGGIAKMLENPTPAIAINYAFMLRGTRYGWTLQDRRDYFTFLKEAGTFSGGASYPGYLTRTRDEALANASTAERAALADLTGEELKPGLDFTVTPPKGPGKTWTLDQAVASVEAPNALTGRDFQSGRNLFHASACASCHQFGGEGGAIGPDLSTVRNKFSTHDLIEAIVDPSKVISDQYGSSVVKFLDGKVVNGIVVEKGDLVEIYSSDTKAKPVSANHSDIASIEPFAISQMPAGLLSPLSENELRDLIAYLMSRGNPEDAMFAK